jgi:dTDP-4-dehydrorhamnose 3,5-epimerase
MALNYCCVHGRIKLVLYDDREGSATRRELQEIFLGPDHYSLVVVPEDVWNGFKGMAPESIVANCATLPHDPVAAGTTRMSPFDTSVIAYDWDVRHE